MFFDVLLFEIRWRRCALPVSVVREVFALSHVTPVPTAPPAVRGLSQLRGQMLPVLDLGIWLGPGTPRAELVSTRPGQQALLVEAASPSPGSETTAARAILLVDRVVRLATVDDSHRHPPPAGIPFVLVTIPDVDGPALLLDPEAALALVRASVIETARASQ